MTSVLDEESVRAAAFSWLQDVTLGGTVPVTREQLANDFQVAGQRFPLVDRGRGIRKPLGWRAALSIMTAVPRSGRPQPYADAEGADGLHRYKLRRDQGGTAENESLRSALRDQVPLIWFYGVAPGLFNAIFPVWLTAEEPTHDQFVLALTESQRAVLPNSPVEESFRRYLIAETKRRLHQPVFASQVMLAYETRCAVCALGHRELLDAAHIIPDSDPRGLPVVSNGLALCKIHHAAYDQNILGIRPDCIVEIHHRLLTELDADVAARAAGTPRQAADASSSPACRPPRLRPADGALPPVPRRLTRWCGALMPTPLTWSAFWARYRPARHRTYRGSGPPRVRKPHRACGGTP